MIQRCNDGELKQSLMIRKISFKVTILLRVRGHLQLTSTMKGVRDVGHQNLTKVDIKST